MIPVKETMSKWDYYCSANTFKVFFAYPAAVFFGAAIIFHPFLTLGLIIALSVALAVTKGK